MKFTVFALFYCVFEGFPSTCPPGGGLIFGGAIERRVFALRVLGGLYLDGVIYGGAYFRSFTVPSILSLSHSQQM